MSKNEKKRSLFMTFAPKIRHYLKRGHSLQAIHEKLHPKIDISYPYFCQLMRELPDTQKTKETVDLFLAAKDSIQTFLDLNLSMKAIHRRLGEQIGIEYDQFRRYMHRFSRLFSSPPQATTRLVRIEKTKSSKKETVTGRPRHSAKTFIYNQSSASDIDDLIED